MQTKLIIATLIISSLAGSALAQQKPLALTPSAQQQQPQLQQVDIPTSSIQIPMKPGIVAPEKKEFVTGASDGEKRSVKSRGIALDDLSLIHEELAIIRAKTMAAEARAELFTKESGERQARRKEQEEIAEFDKKMSKGSKASISGLKESGRTIEQIASVYSIQGFGDDLVAEIYIDGMPSLVTAKIGTSWRGHRVTEITQSSVTFVDSEGEKVTIGVMLGKSAFERLRSRSASSNSNGYATPTMGGMTSSNGFIAPMPPPQQMGTGSLNLMKSMGSPTLPPMPAIQ